ncbi:MAG: ATP-binding protein [Xanthobacteraceae bacterium]
MIFQFSDDQFASIIAREKIETFAQLAKIIETSCDSGGRARIYIAASIPQSEQLCILSNGDSPAKNIIDPNNLLTLFRFNASKYLYEKTIIHEKLWILSNEHVELGAHSTAKVTIRNLISFVLTSRQAHLRNKVVEISYASSDYNSFGYRIIQNLIRPHFKAEACSIFGLDPRNQFLRLASTSGLVSSIEKKDVFYEPDRKNQAMATLQSHDIHLFQSQKVGDDSFFREKMQSAIVYSLLYAPIRRMAANAQHSDKSFGVIKIINPHSGSMTGPKSLFHCVDLMEISYVSELVSVLSHNYVRALEAETNLERTIHGFRSDLESGTDHIHTLGALLFGSPETQEAPQINISSEIFSEQELKRLFDDGVAFLDDLAFQIEKARSLAHSKNEIVSHFHRDVLVPAIKMQRAMVVANSSLPLNINQLTEAGSLVIPPVMGSKSGYISVFRNLLENSIKYSKPGKEPRVAVSFRDDGDYFEISFRDFGIGLAEMDEKYLFVEGFRSLAARQRSFRGAGIGLSYCRDLMKFFEGDLIYKRAPEGTRFIVRMKKAGAQ